MEEMKTFECAICGKKYNDLKSRVACETKCLEEQEKMKKALADDSKKKAKKAAEEKIDKELEVLVKQYGKVTSMIKDYYQEFDEGDVCSSCASTHIPRDIFDLFF